MLFSSGAGCASAAALQERQIAYALPGMERVQRIADQPYRSLSGSPDTVMYGPNLRYDVYLPAGAEPGLRGGVVFIHGGMVAGKDRVSPKDDLPSYRQWGRLVAAAGMVGITFSHRLTTNDNVDVAAQDVEELLRTVRARASEWSLDSNRLCVAVYSAGGPLSSLFLQSRPDPVRCLVLYYPFMDLEHAAVITPFRSAHPPERVAELQRFSPRARLLSSAAATDATGPCRIRRDSRH
jgi:acetyl esterase/lipase